MKNIQLLLATLCLAVLMSSCVTVSTNTKDIKYMPVRFKPLSRNDIILVGELQAQTVITGKVTKKGRELDKEFKDDYKKGLVSKNEATETLYFTPGNGEAITGSLYDNDIFNTIYKPTTTILKHGFFNRLFGKLKIAGPATNDPGVDFAYYAMVEKYPDIDYFINVRFDRKTEQTGKGFKETIVVKADGIKLRVD